MTNEQKRTEGKYIERLAAYLDYIALDSIVKSHKTTCRSVDFINLTGSASFKTKVVYFYSPLILLANIFDEFLFDQDDELIFVSDDEGEMDYLNGAMCFLGLNDMDEFLAIFDASGNNSTELFGTRRLTPKSTLSDIAFNLHQVLQHKRNKISM